MKRPPSLLDYAVTLGMMVFILAPLAITVAVSFSDSPFIVFPPRGFTLRWYGRVLTDPEFLHALGFSLLLALAATAGALALGMPAAFGLVRGRFPGQAACRALLLSPLIFPVLVTGLALLRLVSGLGWEDARLNLLIAHIVVTLPYMVRTVSVSLELADANLEDAARTLGANRWRVFRRVTVPQITPGITAGTIFAFMVSLDNYPASMWLADAGNTPVPILIYQLVARIFDPTVAVISALMICIAIVAVLGMERLVGLRRAMSI
jgi:putative spermidine/putrescine transport system permease protein